MHTFMQLWWPHKDYSKRTFGAVLVLVCTIAATPLLAEQVPIRTETKDGNAFITFGWTDPVAYTHEVRDGRIEIRFSRPIEGAFNEIAAKLGDVIEDGRAGSDGRSVSFGLKRPVDAFAFYTGTQVTVELVPKGPAPAANSAANADAGQPSDTPLAARSKPLRIGRPLASAQAVAGTSTPAADAPQVRVRTGEHPNYTRIVFDFEGQVPFETATNNGVVTVRFARPFNIQTDPLNAGNIRLVGGGRSAVQGNETIVTLAVPTTSNVRAFRAGPKIVVDVREPTGSIEPVSLPAIADATPTPATANPETASAPDEAPAPAAEPVAPVETAAVAPPSAAPAVANEDGRPRALTVGGAAPPPAAAIDADPPSDPELSPRALPLVGGQVAEPAKVTAFPGEDQLAFRFDFTEPVAAATFRRGGAVWIVFDKPLTVDTAALQVQAGEAAFEILQLPSDAATVLRIRTSQRYNPSVSRDGLAWIIDLRDQPLQAQTPLPVNAQPESPVGARVFIPVPEPGRPIPVTDPNVGDNFVVVPVIPLGQGVGLDHQFPQFKIQLAAQGVVINPVIDDLRVRSLRQGIEISASGVQLAISNVSDDAAAHAQLAASRPMVVALEELARYYAPTNQIRVVRREMESAVSSAPEERKAGPRLELAKFFLANAYAPETLGVVQVAISEVPLLENDPVVRVLRGASNFLLGRYQEALADLTHESAAGNDEARLWAAASRAMLGDRVGAARDLRFTGSIARDYPRALKMPLGILIAEVAAETGDGQGAKLFLDALNLEKPTPSERAMLKYAEGLLMQLDGDFETAIALWEDVLESENRPARARARVARTETLLKLRRIDYREAIGEYEKLRFAWRGDKMEFDNLRRLGGMYLDEGYYRKGLETLKAAATNFRDLPEAPEITKLMSDTFNALFLEKEADQIDPVKAIAIYNEFKELTPAGARGDQMIRNLADKLVEVDLLDRAAELLKAQVQFRLVGEEKARVGARLALIYSLAQEFEKALDVLGGTNEPNLTPELVQQRRHLQARVLMGLNRQNDALTLLANDASEPAELLRTELYWDAGNWLEASRSLRLLVKLSGAEDGAPVNQVQAARILSYAVALTNSGGERTIAQLVRDFGPAMRDSTYGEAFQLVTAPSTVGVLDPATVSAKVSEAETFLTAYREKLKDGVPLSSLN